MTKSERPSPSKSPMAILSASSIVELQILELSVHKEGLREDPTNFLLMHAMGPNVAGVIGSAVAAGVLLLLFLG